MKKSMLFALLVCIALVGVLGGIKYLQISTMVEAGKTMLPPPETVSSYEVNEVAWERTLSAVGSLEAYRGVLLSAELQGRVTEIHFTAGSDVKAGDLLVQQDISTEKAQLMAAEANVALTRANLARVKDLVAKNLTSAAEFDTAEARALEALAQRDISKAAIEKKTLVAPFSGRLGIRLINQGQDLKSGDPVVSLQTVDPILVNFYLPQQNLNHLETGLEVRLRTDAWPGETFVGEISAINSEIDQATRNVRVQATLKNADKKLIPGMYASVEVVLGIPATVTVIPVTAVSYATYGDSVFVLEDNSAGQLIARQQFVQLGEARGDLVAVKEGVAPGQTVASAGLFKLLNGAPVAINNDIAPEYSTEPELEDR